MADFVRLGENNIEEIKRFFASVFTIEPWNDDWSDEAQLDAYIMDLIGNRNSLAFGLYEEETMIGLSMGEVVHWYSGTEYYIREFCISTKLQGRGYGKQFMKEIETALLSEGIVQIFLQTERNVPAYAFYKKNGFFELEESVAFRKNLR